MSKQIPESGDVFKSHWGSLYRVDDKDPSYDYYRCYVLQDDDNTGELFITVEQEITKGMLLSMKYLGKSKANIYELFEVESADKTRK